MIFKNAKARKAPQSLFYKNLRVLCEIFATSV